MLKVVATVNNRQTLFLGLDRQNTKRLHAGEPIHFDLQALTAQIADVQDVVICAGETVAEIHAELSQYLPLPEPPLRPTENELRGLFEFRDGDMRWPFYEDENANVTGYGHVDPVEFVDAVFTYDVHMAGSDAERHEPYEVSHKWAVLDMTDEDPENWTMRWGYPVPGQSHPEPYTAETPGAVPITTIWGAR